MTNNAVCNYDFTLWNKEKQWDIIEVKEKLNLIAKKWCFQLEDAGSGEHYQGRFSLKVKKRIGEFSFFSAHLSKTSKENQGNDFYVCKEETRVLGPWRDTDINVPRQVREVESLYTWQKDIEEDIGKWNTRTINIIYDKKGNIGKSTLVAYLCCTRPEEVKAVPALNNYKDIMGMILCMPTAKMYLIDMPRGLDKSHQGEFFSAIEHIKNGHAFDTRYSYKEKWFDCPNIWIFTNVLPDTDFLSPDRWRIWKIEEGKLKALCCNTNFNLPGTSGTTKE